MQVRGFAIESIEALSKIKEMLSCPELCLGFSFLMMVLVSYSSIGVNLNTGVVIRSSYPLHISF